MTGSRPSACARRLALVVGGLVATAARAHGLDPNRAMSQYVRDHWDSFPGGAVRAITQTADGYLWIGTGRGLVRFDGLEFAVVRGSGSRGAPISDVMGLCPGPRGELWVRLPGSDVLVYRDGEFAAAVPRVPPEADAFTSMSPTRAGGIVLAGLVSGISRSTRDGFETLARGVAARAPVVAIGEGPDGKIWLGTRGAGLFFVESGQAKVVGALADRRINCVLPLSGSEVWVGTDDGVVKWDGTALVRAGVPPPLRRGRVLAMLKDRDANLWVGTGTGPWRVNGSGAALLDGPDGTRGPVTALFEDREGNLWTGNERGIERLRDSRFATYATAEGLPSDTNGPVYADADGRTWFAPLEGGLYWLHGGAATRVDAAGLAADVVYSVVGARDGVWVGRRRGGLTHLAVRHGRVESRTFTRANGLVQDAVYAVHESRDGTVWAASLSEGVSRLRGGRITTYTAADGLASDTVASIVDDAEGTTWFATPTGLSAFADDAWRTYTTRDGLPSDEVSCLRVGSSGVLWIGTGDGLAFRASGRIQPVALGQLSRGEQVLGLAEDASGWLWVATSRRILRVTEASVVGAAPSAVEVNEFGHGDGLRGVEGVKRHRSVVADSLGRIWISTNAGLSVVEPARLRRPEPVAPRVLGVAADGRALSLGTDVVVPAGRQRVTVRFGGVSLSIPERLRFRYRLDGFDDDWSEPTSSREARYTNLAHGSYAFRVRAFGLGEGWIGPETTVGIVVEPALWQRGWVRVLALVVAGTALAALYRSRVRRVTRQLNLRFEERLSERLRIAQELHDTLLQGLASASMQLHVARNQLPPDSSAQPLLGRVQRLMGQVIDEGRNTLRGLRSAESDPGALPEAFARVPDEIATSSPAAVRVIVDGSPRPLRAVVRDEVYRIGREALVNALRHSGARRIEVEVEYASRALHVLVRDDGSGIDPEVLRSGRDGHFGLSGMRERAEKLGARLTVWSAAGGGTEVALSVRGALAFAAGRAHGPLAWVRRRFARRVPDRPASTGGDS